MPSGTARAREAVAGAGGSWPDEPWTSRCAGCSICTGGAGLLLSGDYPSAGLRLAGYVEHDVTCWGRFPGVADLVRAGSGGERARRVSR